MEKVFLGRGDGWVLRLTISFLWNQPNEAVSINQVKPVYIPTRPQPCCALNPINPSITTIHQFAYSYTATSVYSPNPPWIPKVGLRTNSFKSQ